MTALETVKPFMGQMEQTPKMLAMKYIVLEVEGIPTPILFPAHLGHDAMVPKVGDVKGEACKKAIEALDIWLQTYASEFCDKKTVDAARKHLWDNGGTIGYITDVLEQLRAAIAERPVPKVISAGFCEVESDDENVLALKVTVSGHSTSLGVSSRAEDAELIAKLLKG